MNKGMEGCHSKFYSWTKINIFSVQNRMVGPCLTAPNYPNMPRNKAYNWRSRNFSHKFGGDNKNLRIFKIFLEHSPRKGHLWGFSLPEFL